MARHLSNRTNRTRSRRTTSRSSSVRSNNPTGFTRQDNSKLKNMPSNPKNDTREQRRTRNLLVRLFGLAIALQILRRARQ